MLQSVPCEPLPWVVRTICSLDPTQVANAQRFRFAMERFPRTAALFERCMALEPFIRAHPESQPDRN